jgi:uncharacterized membrane protein
MNRTTRNLILALAASVVLNVFFLGIAAGRLIRRGHEPASPGEIERSVDAPMRGVWRNHDGALRRKGEAVRMARRAVREALVAEPFNATALESSLTHLRAETDDAQVALHAALVEAARELSPEERRRLADSRGFLRGPFQGPPRH